MLIDDIERYIALRQSLGFKLQKPARQLRSFARFAMARGESHIRAATAVAWAATAPTPEAGHRWLGYVVRLARFLRAEDPAHEIPPEKLFAIPKSRPVPYIYTPDELTRILDTAGQLRQQKPNPLRRQLYVTLFGLIAATGLRVSEALNLRLGDMLPGGVLHIRETKFNKSRLVPLHKSVVDPCGPFLTWRRRFAGWNDLFFLSRKGPAFVYPRVTCTSRGVLHPANIAPGRPRRPRIHDLRHSFATRVLQQCGTERDAVARHFVALATYMGHADIAHTYWYLQATPELMTDIAAAAEVLIEGATV